MGAASRRVSWRASQLLRPSATPPGLCSRASMKEIQPPAPGAGESDLALGLEAARIEDGAEAEAGRVEGQGLRVVQPDILDVEGTSHLGRLKRDLASGHQARGTDVALDAGVPQTDRAGHPAVGKYEVALDAQACRGERGQPGPAQVQLAYARFAQIGCLLEVAGNEPDLMRDLGVRQVQPAGDRHPAQTQRGYLAVLDRAGEQQSAQHRSTVQRHKWSRTLAPSRASCCKPPRSEERPTPAFGLTLQPSQRARSVTA